MLDLIGWYCGNGQRGSSEVAQKEPNAWGIYDMSGNVREFCWDWYTSYSAEPQVDPVGPESGTYRTLRSGSFGVDAAFCRSASRTLAGPGTAHLEYGLRIARWAQ